MNLSLGYVYALARDPADPAHPENTGAERDPVTRLVSLLETVSTYPHLRPLLREWALYFEALMARLLDRQEDPAGNETLVAHAAACARESGEAVAATLAHATDSGDFAVALREVLEAAEAVNRLARTLLRHGESEGISAIRRRA